MRFFHAIGHFFQHLFGGQASWSQKALGVIHLVAPLLQTILTLTVGAGAGTEVQAVIGEIQTSIAALSALVAGVSTTPDASTAAQISSLLGSIESNLKSLLAAGHIKDPNTLAKVTAITDSIVSELQVILSELPQQTQPPAAAAAKA